MIARSVNSRILHDIVDYCVPQRLLRSFTIWAQRGNDGLMRLNVRIDYDENDRQIELTGDGLPSGIAGSCVIESGAPGVDGTNRGRSHVCLSINKAIDLFVKTAKDRGLYLTWDVSFTDRHEELSKKFGFSRGGGTNKFRDLTVGAPLTKFTCSRLVELEVTAAIAPDTPDDSATHPKECDE
ncbi:MAG: hypothetical protein J5J06_15470 [Phycisphaerae bacterium]|nr:hypothetical protein [Phycisphaerae bacterium]